MVYRSSSKGGGDSSDEEESSPTNQRTLNVFRNDGSFLEMFKKMQEKQQKDKAAEQKDETSTSDSESKTSTSSSNVGSSSTAGSTTAPRPPLVGKRRGGRVLPTGRVKKSKVENESEEPPPKDAWSVYLAEVKRYKETTCEEDGKTRPLVK